MNKECDECGDESEILTIVINGDAVCDCCLDSVYDGGTGEEAAKRY